MIVDTKTKHYICIKNHLDQVVLKNHTEEEKAEEEISKEVLLLGVVTWVGPVVDEGSLAAVAAAEAEDSRDKGLMCRASSARRP